MVEKFTPGDWTLTATDEGYTIEGYGVILAELPSWRLSDAAARDEATANAHLIAAAPDLLKMLNAVVEAEFDATKWPLLQQNILETLSKAKGETKI